MDTRPPIRTRLYVGERLETGARIAVDTARCHFLRRVLRLGEGDAVGLFNAGDGEWLARIVSFGRRDGELVVETRYRDPAPEAGPWLLFAPLKRNPTDLLVAKATELGVARLMPVMTRRTVADRVNLDRLRSIVLEAAEQTERLSLPTIDAPVSLADALAALPTDRALVFCAEAGDARPIAEALAPSAPASGVADEAASRVAPPVVLIGPEGGFTETEQLAIRVHPGCLPVGLGPRLLRAETAALAALACVQALCGDWGRRPPHRSLEDWRVPGSIRASGSQD